MKIQVSNTNAPCWRDITVKSQVPSELNNLVTMSKNLWWVWNSEAIDLFRNIDPDLWRSTNNNPVLMLQRIGYRTHGRNCQRQSYDEKNRRCL